MLPDRLCFPDDVKHTSDLMILYFAERKRTSKKMGCQRKGSPACCHLLCKVTGAPGNQGKGCTQTSTDAADGLGGCMCMSIPAKRNKRKKGGEKSGMILGIPIPGKQTLWLGSCPL